MQTNEFRVRPVTRFVLTHHQADDEAGNSGTRTVGEFPNVQAAEEVGVALQALVPGSTLTTIEGRQAEYPPRALAAAMAVRGDEAVRERSAAWLRITEVLSKHVPNWATLDALGVEAAVKAIESLAEKHACQTPKRPQVGDVIPVIVTNEGDVQLMRVTSVTERQLIRMLDCTFPDGMFLNGRGTGRVLDEQPYRMLVENGGIADSPQA